MLKLSHRLEANRHNNQTWKWSLFQIQLSNFSLKQKKICPWYHKFLCFIQVETIYSQLSSTFCAVYFKWIIYETPAPQDGYQGKRTQEYSQTLSKRFNFSLNFFNSQLAVLQTIHVHVLSNFKLVLNWFWTGLNWFWTGFELVLNWFWTGFELGLNWGWTGFELVLNLFSTGFTLVLN